MENSYMSTPCGISDQNNDRLMSHVETETNVEICVPADGKSKAHIIRQLSDSKCMVKCLWCGDEFVTYYCKVKAGRGKYCNRNCLGNANGAQRILDRKGLLTPGRVSGKSNPNWKGGDFVDCLICGNPFWLYPSRNQETCSPNCGVLRADLVRSGKLYSLGNRRRDYAGAVDWGRTRVLVMEIYDYTCQKCNQYFKRNTGFLHIHHIKRIVDGGSNRLHNLIPLCRDCHTYEHRFDRIR